MTPSRCFLCGRPVVLRWWEFLAIRDICRPRDYDRCRGIFVTAFTGQRDGGPQ